MCIEKQFKNTDKLYHFTTLDSAIKIIESNSLRFGRLNKMNDIHETSKNMFANYANYESREFPEKLLNELYNEIYRYRQISFTRDTKDKCGFDLHNMWGLYANKFEGVCLVFDKKELLEQISNSGDDIYKGKVSYDRKINSSITSEKTDIAGVPSITKENANDIFFHKQKEWEHEQEFRLIKKCPIWYREEYLFLGDSLKYIILSNILKDVDDVRYDQNIRKIKSCAKPSGKEDIPILIYGNGLFEYSLISHDGEYSIWNSNDGYDLPDLT